MKRLGITMDMYVLQKLSARIAELETENARLEFSALKYKQDAEELQKQLEEMKKKQEASDTNITIPSE